MNTALSNNGQSDITLQSFCSAPEVSIIVPCYNGMRTLQSCLQSLIDLSPDSPSHEIIIVDNGSDDGSLEALTAHPGIQLVREHEIRGPSAARNRGVAVAKGRILAFTDIDCVVSQEWLIKSVPRLNNSDIVGVGGAIEGVRPKNRIQQWMNSRKILDQERALANPFMPYLQTANALFRRDAFNQAGGFDQSLYCGEDCDLSWRIQRNSGGRLEYAADAIVYHDHRCSIRGLFRQSMKNAMGGAHLAKKWHGAIPPKSWKNSVWECWGIIRALKNYLLISLLTGDRRQKFELRLDLIHRIARKAGMILSAAKTGQYSQW